MVYSQLGHVVQPSDTSVARRQARGGFSCGVCACSLAGSRIVLVTGVGSEQAVKCTVHSSLDSRGAAQAKFITPYSALTFQDPVLVGGVGLGAGGWGWQVELC